MEELSFIPLIVCITIISLFWFYWVRPVTTNPPLEDVDVVVQNQSNEFEELFDPDLDKVLLLLAEQLDGDQNP